MPWALNQFLKSSFSFTVHLHEALRQLYMHTGINDVNLSKQCL